jgi:hypothetical protein
VQHQFIKYGSVPDTSFQVGELPMQFGGYLFEIGRNLRDKIYAFTQSKFASAYS